jgi:hypothetical protein
LRHNETQRCHHLSNDHKDIYARALSRPLTVLDRVRREREPGDRPGQRRNVNTARNAGIGPDHPLDRGGVGGEFRARRYIDLLPEFCGPVSQKWRGPVLKFSDRLVKPAALTHGSPRIRQIGWAASRAASEPKTAPATLPESRRGVLP